MQSDLAPRPWMTIVLRAAGIYNLLWGAAVVALPQTTLAWAGLAASGDIVPVWRCVGMMVGVYGVAYLLAARNPFRLWPIVLVGLLGKVLGPIGFVSGLISGSLPASLGWTILLNDLMWWLPFAMILWATFRHSQAVSTVHSAALLDDDPVRELRGTTGESLYELSAEKPQLVIFLRHAGCTFCREALADLARERQAIEQTGAGIVLVHMGEEERAADFLARYGLDDLPRISDPACRLYCQFGLEMGSFPQLFGLKVWLRGLKAGLVDGHGLGALEGNPFQMPGAFVLHCGRFLCGFQHQQASDRPDYLGLVREALKVEAGAVA